MKKSVIHNPQRIRKGTKVTIIGSNRIAKVLSIKNGIANLDKPILEFRNWDLQILDRVNK